MGCRRAAWYAACVERNDTNFVLSVSGDFKWGGQQTYAGSIPIASVYQAKDGIPDFFMFGDPHNNYYRGFVYYDDIRLEPLAGPLNPDESCVPNGIRTHVAALRTRSPGPLDDGDILNFT